MYYFDEKVKSRLAQISDSVYRLEEPVVQYKVKPGNDLGNEAVELDVIF